MDPFSITTGVVGLLGTCVSVVKALNDFCASVATVDTKITGLREIVQDFVQVLTLMKDTLEQEETKSSLNSTGHINNHWSHISTSIKDGQKIAPQLENLLEKVDGNAAVLIRVRKHGRLESAAPQILVYQQQIQHCSDTMQLSMQAVIIWNQATLQQSADKIPPKLDTMHRDIRRIAYTLHKSMTDVQPVVEWEGKESQRQDENRLQIPEQLRTLANLRDCVQSAATIVSDASTTLGLDQGAAGSEFEGCFPPERDENITRWISVNTIYEDHPGPGPSTHQRTVSAGRGMDVVSADIEFDDSDSETEQELEGFHALFAKGEEMLREGDFSGAEVHFLDCFDKIASHDSKISSNLMSQSKSDLIKLLLDTYRKQKKLGEAKNLLMETIGSDPSLITDMDSLAEALFQNEDYPNALECAKRARRIYRKLGPEGASGAEAMLQMLIKVCKTQGNQGAQREYEALLSHPPKRAESRRDSLASADRSPRQNVVLGNNASPRRPPPGTPLSPTDCKRPVRAQPYQTNSPDEIAPFGEDLFVRWGQSSAETVSNPNINAASSHWFSDDHHSPWSLGSVTTPEPTGSVRSDNSGRTGMSPEIGTPKRTLFRTNLDGKGLPLPLSYGYFDSIPQPSNFKVGRHGQTWSSSSSGHGEPKHINKFTDELNNSFNATDPPGQLKSAFKPFTVEEDLRKARKGKYAHEGDDGLAARFQVPLKNEYESETSTQNSQSKKTDEEGRALKKSAGLLTLPKLLVRTGSHVSLDPSISEETKLYKKIVVVGDGKCGKTPLLTLMTKGNYSEYPPPTEWLVYKMDIEIDNKRVDLAIWESGSNDKKGLPRLLSSPKAQAFLICFSIDSPTSLYMAQKKWVLEVQKFGKKVPYILVGLKNDLRADPRTIEHLEKRGQHPVTAAEGQAVADLIKADQYLECSAKTGEGVKEVLEAATRLTLADDFLKDLKRKKKEDVRREMDGDDKSLMGSKGIRSLLRSMTK